MTKRTSKAAGTQPAAQEGASAAAIPGVAAADVATLPAAGGGENAGVASPIVPGAPADAAAAALDDGAIAGIAAAASGALSLPDALDAGDPNVALATVAVHRICDAATIEEAFDAVIDAAPLVALVLGFGPFPDAPDHMVAPFVGADLAGQADATALAEMDLKGRVLNVRTANRGTRYRAGRQWGPEAGRVEVDTLTEGELGEIMGDAHLIVTVEE